MIEVRKLCKQYAGKHALTDLDLSAENGGVIGFIGPNGAGKSTAMKMICGIMPPTSGSILISGIDMVRFPREAKEKIGYLPENAPLYSGMNVAAFLDFCGKMRGLAGKQLEDAIAESVEKCRLKEVYREELESLSKGFKRRVCLAQAIMHHPENLVLDEPTDGLDPDQKREIRHLIRELRMHASIIVSTHILEEVDAVCDNVLAIRKGHCVFSGTAAQFRALDPDDGILLFRFASGFKEEAFRTSGSFRIVSAEQKDGAAELRVHPAKGIETEKAMRDVFEAASASGQKIIYCETGKGNLEKVFANLDSERKERGK